MGCVLWITAPNSNLTTARPVQVKNQGLRFSPKPFEKIGAGEEIRTLDIDLGKVALYHWATPATLFPVRPCVRSVFAIRIESGQEFFKRIFRIIFESSYTDLKINPLLSKAIDCVLFEIFFKKTNWPTPHFSIVFILFGFLTLQKPICA